MYWFVANYYDFRTHIPQYWASKMTWRFRTQAASRWLNGHSSTRRYLQVIEFVIGDWEELDIHKITAALLEPDRGAFGHVTVPTNFSNDY
jgi:hypothetical protein